MNQHENHPKTIPGPEGYPFIGIAPKLIRNPLKFCTETAHQFSEDIVCLDVGLTKVYLVTHPRHIKHILANNHRNYVKGKINEEAEILFGKGLGNSDGQLWLQQRRMIQPAFNRQRLVDLAATVTDTTIQNLKRWEPYGQSQQPLNMSEEITVLTMDVILKTMFGAHLSYEEGKAIGDAVKAILKHINVRLFTFFLPKRIPRPGERRARQALQKLDTLVYRLIEEGRRNKEQTGEFLSLLLAAYDEETGQGMSDKQLRDEIISLFVAGHETVAAAVTWTLYLLSQHPEVEQKLYQEISTVLGNRFPTADDLSQLTYTRMVFQEALRFYPPGWMFYRTSIDSDEIDGFTIPANASILIGPYMTHRNPEFWDHPEQFDPERFNPAHDKKRHPYAFIPFGGGPRRCIGEHFAMMEGTFILAILAQAYQFQLVPGQVVEPLSAATLKPRHDIMMTLHKRPLSSKETPQSTDARTNWSPAASPQSSGCPFSGAHSIPAEVVVESPI